MNNSFFDAHLLISVKKQSENKLIINRENSRNKRASFCANVAVYF